MSIIEQALDQLERKERLGPMAKAYVPPPSRRGSGWLLVTTVFVVLFFGGGAALLWWLQAKEGAVVIPPGIALPAQEQPTSTSSVVAGAAEEEVEVRFTSSQAPLAEDSLSDARQRAPGLSGPLVIVEHTPVDSTEQPGRGAAAQQTASAQRSAAGPSAAAPRWIADGLSQLRAGDTAAALQIWENGLEQLDKQRLVVVLGAYFNDTFALLNADKYGSRYPIFMVRGVVNERPGYYLLALPGETEYEAVREQLAWEFDSPHLRGNHAERILARLVAARELLAAASVTTTETQARVSGEAAPERETKSPATGDARVAKQREEHPAPRVERAQSAPQPAVSATAAPRSSPDVEQRATLGRAIHLVQAADYAAGRDLLQGVIAGGFDGWEAWFWLGTAYLGTGDLVAADHALSEALRRDPAQPQLWIQRAIIAQERGDHAQALGWLREARNLSPQAPEVHLNIGYSAEAMGLREEAVKAYRDFLRFTEGRESFASQRTWVTRRLGIM